MTPGHEFLQFTESSTFYFFSTAAQCVAAVAGLSAAFSTFHYQNLLARIRERRDQLFEKYDPMGAGLKKEYAETYKKLRSTEQFVDFWRSYFESEDKGGHQHVGFDDMYELVKQTRKFRALVVRVSFYGFAVLLPLGVLGTLLPAAAFLGPAVQLGAKAVYGGLLLFYFLLNLSLARSVFINPWPKG